jgi:Domain of unknown function (DUF4845)
MRNKQRGVTFLGWVILLIPFALMIYLAIRLTPVYVNYMAVAKAMNKISSEVAPGTAVDERAIRFSLDKSFNIEGINFPSIKDNFRVQRDGDDIVAIIEYEEVAPVIANVSILVQFKKQVKLQ